MRMNEREEYIIRAALINMQSNLSHVNATYVTGVKDPLIAEWEVEDLLEEFSAIEEKGKKLTPLSKIQSLMRDAKTLVKLKGQIENLSRDGIGDKIFYNACNINFMGITVKTLELNALNTAWEEMEGVRISMIRLLQKLYEEWASWCLYQAEEITKYYGLEEEVEEFLVACGIVPVGFSEAFLERSLTGGPWDGDHYLCYQPDDNVWIAYGRKWQKNGWEVMCVYDKNGKKVTGKIYR